MEITNGSQEQIRCAGHSLIPDLSYPNMCAITIWQQGLNLTDDPLSVLKSCCPSDQYSYFGPDNCFAYCNATKETQATLEQCLQSPTRLRAVMCNGSMGLRSLTSYLVLAVIFTSLWHI
ncbi:hypothetical protein BDV59DRAFT_177084 [Aspergillus ambiguus]|uniref:uncharacterized protein n=1 Tax=Aspergillus ambiguus TaxID=176160 RepID=UPI003CCCE4CB